MVSLEITAASQGTPQITQPRLARVRLSLRDRLSLAVATIGVGYVPVVPATWASAVTTAFYWVLMIGVGSLYQTGLTLNLTLPTIEVFRLTCLLILIIPLGIIAIWAAGRAERLFGKKDPKQVVIDEVVGQLLTFLFIPYTAGVGLIVIAFFMFRAFDIFKPYPVRHLESLKGGLGIVADDALAGGYAATVMLLLTYVPFFR